MQDEHSLLQVVDRRQGARAADACRAVKQYFVIVGYIGELLLVEQVFAPALAPVVHPQVLNNSFNDFVVLFFGGAKVGPRQVLKLRDDSAIYDDPVGVFLGQLEPALDQVGHEALDGDEQHLLVVVEGDALH